MRNGAQIGAIRTERSRIVSQQQKPTAAHTNTIPDPRDLPRGSRWFGKALIFFLTRRNRLQTLRGERKRIPALESAIATLKAQKIKAQELGLVHAERIHNVGLYLLLMDRDFSVLKVDMVSTLENWRLRFVARQMALLLYEVCDDLSHMLGKDFRASLMFLEIGKDEMLEFEQTSKQLSQFKKSNHQFLYHDIRNLIAGHRAQDSLLFLETVEQLDPMKVFRLGAGFFEIIHRLISFLTRVMTKMGRMNITLKQLLASQKYVATLDSK